MSDFTNDGEAYVCDLILADRSNTLHISLHTADPAEDQQVATEVSLAGYARVAAACSRNGSQIENDADVLFAALAENVDITHAAFWTAASGGTCIGTYDLTDSGGTPTSYTWTSSLPFRFAANELVFEVR